jgi:aspartate/methionine/tyrosine aminotransferase
MPAVPRQLSQSASLIRSSVFADLIPRIEAQARKGAGLIGLHLGDSFRRPPDGVRYQGIEDPAAADGELYRYGDVGGLAGLKEEFAAQLASLGHGPVGVDSRHVLVGCGATHALFCAARTILEAGDEVLVAAPYWPLAVGVIRAAGATPVEVPLTCRLYEDPSIDPESLLAKAITGKTRALYIATPNNPDGKVLTARQLAGIARVARAHDLWIIADEVYCDYVYEGTHTSIARFEDAADRTLSAYSLSKSRALAGLRVGFVVGPERVITVARRIATHTVFHPTVAAQRLALLALRAPSSWVDEARSDYRRARDSTVGALAGAGLALNVPEGGSYIFVDFSRVLAGRPLKDLLEAAIDAGVLLAPGDGFGGAFASWARLCFTAVTPDRLREGVSRLIGIL